MTWVNLSLYPSIFWLVPCLSFYRRGHSFRACQHCAFLLSSPRFYAERKRVKESKSVCVCGEMWLMKTWFTGCGLLRVPDVSQTLSLAQLSPHTHLMALWKRFALKEKINWDFLQTFPWEWCLWPPVPNLRHRSTVIKDSLAKIKRLSLTLPFFSNQM